jgi:hypothetical protein
LLGNSLDISAENVLHAKDLIQHAQPTPGEPAEDVFAFLGSVPAAFLTEIAKATHRSIDEISSLLDAAPSRVLIVSNPPPDRHVTSDQRIASIITDGDELAAHDRIARHWRAWVREFMAAHRCG